MTQLGWNANLPVRTISKFTLIEVLGGNMSESKVYYMDAHSESTETALSSKMITVFDATGLAIEDVATARYIYEKVK